MLRQKEHRLDVHLHHAAKILRLLGDDAAAAADADIVVEKVEPAPAIDRCVDEALAVRFAGRVEGFSRCRAAFFLDHLHRALGELDVAIGHQHFRAGAGEEDGCGAAVADAVAGRSAAAQDGDLVCKASVVFWALHHVPPDGTRR